MSSQVLPSIVATSVAAMDEVLHHNLLLSDYIGYRHGRGVCDNEACDPHDDPKTYHYTS